MCMVDMSGLHCLRCDKIWRKIPLISLQTHIIGDGIFICNTLILCSNFLMNNYGRELVKSWCNIC